MSRLLLRFDLDRAAQYNPASAMSGDYCRCICVLNSIRATARGRDVHQIGELGVGRWRNAFVGVGHHYLSWRYVDLTVGLGASHGRCVEPVIDAIESRCRD